jgi:hypothetical protein
MMVRRELARRGERSLVEVQFVGVSGQVCSTTWKITGPEPQVFTSRARAEAAFAACRVAEPA